VYTDKTNEQLIEILEELKQENEDLKSEIQTAKSDSKDYDSAILNNEKVVEKAFYAGFTEGSRTLDPLKPWLNYRMEARL